MSQSTSVYSKFETEMLIRPSDIDMNQHVHSSTYLDYVLAARYDQMARCYKMSMDEFLKAGFGWVVRAAHLEYKRPLMLNDVIVITTWVAEIAKSQVKVHFQITKKATGKLACDGYFDYTMVNLQTGRAEAIPDWIRAKYSV